MLYIYVREANEDADALYQYFLIDVQVDGCARTSRLVAAIAALQLYVHRILMNLEQDRRRHAEPEHIHVPPEAIPRDEWAWRKNYRVWEANRKVFLYPENYIEPELRDDKTPLFEELESTLLQKEINEQNVLESYGSYVNSFEAISRLRIAGAFHDRSFESETDRLHLFGVTPSDPPLHYYRTIENTYFSEVAETPPALVYGPWRPIRVQIGSRKVSPVMYLGRLFLFWVEISSISKNKITAEGSALAGYRHRLTLRYTTLKLDGTWAPPQSLALASREIFPFGDGVVDDALFDQDEQTAFARALDDGRLADALDIFKTKFTPRYDDREHLEPVDGYSLSGLQWDRVYPHVEGDQPLRITARNFQYRAEVDFYHKTTARAPGNAATFADGALGVRVEEERRRLFHLEPGVFQLDEYAGLAAYSDHRAIDVIEIAPETTHLAGLLRTSLSRERIADVSASAEIEIINGSARDAIIDTDGDLILPIQ